MKFRLAKFAVLLLTTSCALSLWAGDAIPKHHIPDQEIPNHKDIFGPTRHHPKGWSGAC